MMSRSLGTGRLLLQFTTEELGRCGLCPRSVTAAHVLELLRRAACRGRLSLPPQLKIESFPSPNGLLLFVHARYT